MSTVLRSLMIKIGADLSGAQKGLQQMGKDLKASGKDLSSSGQSLTKGLTVPILGAVAGLTGLAINAGKTADELITLSNKTGISTKQLQEMEYAARFVDVEVETMTGSMQKLTKNMDMARDGSKDQVEAFKALRVEFKNQDGTLRNAKDVWAEVIDALGDVGSEADRDALAMKLFGKSAAELNPLIKAGSVELNRLGKEAHTVGAVMSDENVKALGQFDDEMQKVQAVLKNSSGEIASSFIPALKGIQPIVQDKIVPAIKKFAELIGELIEGFNDLSPTMKNVVLGLSAFAVGIGPVLSVAGKVSTSLGNMAKALSAAGKAASVASAAGSGIGGFGAALSSLIGPTGYVVLAAAAVAVLTTAMVTLYKKAHEADAKINDLIESCEKSETAFAEQRAEIESSSKVTQILADRLFALADKENKTNAEIAIMKGLVSELNGLMPDLNLQIDAQTGKLNLNREAVSNLIAEKKKQLMLIAYEERLLVVYKEKVSLEEKMEAAQKKLTLAQEAYTAAQYRGHPAGFLPIQNALIDAQKNVDKLTSSMNANKNKIAEVEKSYGKMASNISASTAVLTGAEGEMYTYGKNAGQGFVNGMRSQLDEIVAAAKAMGKSVPYNIRRILEIESPSKVLRAAGAYTSEGFALGVSDNIDMIKRASLSMASASLPHAQGQTSTTGTPIPERNENGTGSAYELNQSFTQSKGNTFIVQIGSKTILETVITEKQRRNARAGRNVITVGV